VRTEFLRFDSESCTDPKGIQAGTEDDVLADAAAGLFHNQIFDKASTGHDRGAEEARAHGVHVWSLAPVIVRSDQLEANLVFEDMRRQINLDMYRPPQGDSYSCVFWPCDLLVIRHVLSHFNGLHTHPRSRRPCCIAKKAKSQSFIPHLGSCSIQATLSSGHSNSL
jgi:hypothetical protein